MLVLVCKEEKRFGSSADEARESSKQAQTSGSSGLEVKCDFSPAPFTYHYEILLQSLAGEQQVN
jgi:hypothetical protein